MSAGTADILSVRKIKDALKKPQFFRGFFNALIINQTLLPKNILNPNKTTVNASSYRSPHLLYL